MSHRMNDKDELEFVTSYFYKGVSNYVHSKPHIVEHLRFLMLFSIWGSEIPRG